MLKLNFATLPSNNLTQTYRSIRIIWKALEIKFMWMFVDRRCTKVIIRFRNSPSLSLFSKEIFRQRPRQ